MKVSGFTFVRNAVKYDYPIVEAITSILPLCDEVVVAVGNSDDDTLNLIQSIPSNKIKIIETIWDDSLREGGKVLAQETDKAFQAIAKDADWAFYIQGDEVLHEDYIPDIKNRMQEHLTNPTIDGLLFNYHHFYGSYDFIGSSLSWYPYEIRIIRNDKNIYSYRDAQGFRKGHDKKLNVKLANAYMHHYGWVKEPKAMQAKQKTFQKLWHDDKEAANRAGNDKHYVYEKNMHRLEKFTDTHPKVMLDRIERLNWDFDYKPSNHPIKIKDRFKLFCKKYLKLDFGYRNYNLHK